MLNTLVNLGISYAAGVFAPLGAVCVLPLYPGFLAYLSNQINSGKKKYFKLGLIVTAGILTAMMVVGLIVSAALKTSLTKAIGVISPIAFVILAIVSIFMVFNFDLGKLFPQVHAPILKKPYLTSYVFGLFFGAIVLPCNPASLVVLFALSTTTTDFVLNLLNFTVFGLGMATPLLILAALSNANVVINTLVKHKRKINLFAGLIMLGVSLYYLIFVFRIFTF